MFMVLERSFTREERREANAMMSYTSAFHRSFPKLFKTDTARLTLGTSPGGIDAEAYLKDSL
jgi:hypothetical protein